MNKELKVILQRNSHNTFRWSLKILYHKTTITLRERINYEYKC